MPIKAAVRNLSKAYGPVRAVSDLSLEIGGGEILGLLGPNGAGKTTAVEAIIGLIEPDAGAVEICGIDARAHPRRARQMIGVALQSTGLQDKITPREALAMFGAFYPSPSDPKMLIERFGLAEKADAAFDTLSGGQRQRLALALAFANDPQVLFLDEPTASLDPQMRRELHGHIRQMRQEGRAVLLTTHDMEEAAQLCDRVAVIDAGRIIAQGSPGDLIATSQAAVTVTLRTTAPIDPAWTAALPHVGEMTTDAAGARFTASDLNRALAELVPVLDAHGVQITALNAGRATLEDVILDLTGAAPRE